MVLLLSKFIALPLYPVGLVVTVLCSAVVLFLLKRIKAGIIATTLATFLLLFFSSPFVANAVIASLEKHYPQTASCPPCGAVVLLGGAGVPQLPPRLYPETNSAADRVIHAARLMKSGCAPYLIITGGKISFIKDFSGSEAEINARLLIDVFGIDSSRIIIEPLARTTKEHGPLVDSILRVKGLTREVALVTSASHMVRSVKVFRKQGITVHAQPTDFRADIPARFTFYDLFPKAAALDQITAAMHEFYGLIAYRVLGWI